MFNSYEEKRNPYRKIIWLIIGLAFFYLGIVFLVNCFTNFKLADFLQKDPVTNLKDIKSAKLIKFEGIPDKKILLKSPVSSASCIYYYVEYLEYYYDEYEKGTYSNLTGINAKPDNLTFISGEIKYNIKLTHPNPRLWLKNTKFYRYNTVSKKYVETETRYFINGDKIAKEFLIQPGEKVFLFGRISSVFESEKDKNKIISFDNSGVSEQREYKNSNWDILLDHLYLSKEMPFVVSTIGSELIKNHYDNSSTIIFAIAGIFCIIPGIATIVKIMDILSGRKGF